MNQSLRRFIIDFICQRVAQASGETPYREPLVGFADANDPAWARLREVADPQHHLPSDLLADARSVISFFIPFGKAVVNANRRAPDVAREWDIAYRETNQLISEIVASLAAALRERGVGSAFEPPTYNFDRVTFSCRWSHKSVAAIAGLGSFGLHHLLITDSGSAGRCGSLVIDAELEPTSGRQSERCLYFHDESCTYCIDACPAGALRLGQAGERNLDKKRCDEYLRGVKARMNADCCGKCSMGPCALGSAV